MRGRTILLATVLAAAISLPDASYAQLSPQGIIGGVPPPLRQLPGPFRPFSAIFGAAITVVRLSNRGHRPPPPRLRRTRLRRSRWLVWDGSAPQAGLPPMRTLSASRSGRTITPPDSAAAGLM